VVESDVDDEFAEAAAVLIVGFVAKGINHKWSFQSHAHHFLAWNRTVF